MRFPKYVFNFDTMKSNLYKLIHYEKMNLKYTLCKLHVIGFLDSMQLLIMAYARTCQSLLDEHVTALVTNRNLPIVKCRALYRYTDSVRTQQIK